MATFDELDEVSEDEDQELPSFLTAEERLSNRDTYIGASGGGTLTVGPYVISHKDGGEIQLKGGDTGATFYGFFFWSKPRYAGLGKALDANIRLSKAEGIAYAEFDEATTDNYLEKEKALKDIRTEQDGVMNINTILEIDNISLNPGETFTIKNREDYYAQKFLIERVGFVQWVFGFKVVQLAYNAGLDENDEFGQEIEDKIDVKDFAKSFYKWLRPGQAAPEDFEISSEEEGGFTEQTGDPLLQPLISWFSDVGDTVLPYIKGALIIVGCIIVIFMLFTFRAPIGALADVTADLLQEAMDRD